MEKIFVEKKMTNMRSVTDKGSQWSDSVLFLLKFVMGFFPVWFDNLFISSLTSEANQLCKSNRIWYQTSEASCLTELGFEIKRLTSWSYTKLDFKELELIIEVCKGYLSYLILRLALTFIHKRSKLSLLIWYEASCLS